MPDMRTPEIALLYNLCSERSSSLLSTAAMATPVPALKGNAGMHGTRLEALGCQLHGWSAGRHTGRVGAGGRSRAEHAHAAQVADELVIRGIGAVADDGSARDHAQELVQGHSLPSSPHPAPDRIFLRCQASLLSQVLRTQESY